MARNLKKLEIYNLSYNFVLEIYQCTKDFPLFEEQNITSQIRRAAVSVPLNIAEGSAKASKKEFLNYLNIAYGSAKEVEVLLQLCSDLKCLSKQNYFILSEKLDMINAKLFLSA